MNIREKKEKGLQLAMNCWRKMTMLIIRSRATTTNYIKAETAQYNMFKSWSRTDYATYRMYKYGFFGMHLRAHNKR